MKTVHFFACYLHNLPENTFFAPQSSMNPKIAKSLHFDRDGWGCSAASLFFRCAIYLLQMNIQSSSGTQSVFFKFQLPHLWDFTPDFMMIYPCFYDDLLLLLWWGGWIYTKSPWILPWFCFWRWLQYFPAENTKFSSQENNCFQPREFYSQYENQLHSLREYTSFFTGMHFILVKNEVYSHIEHKILSAGNNYFPGLKILYSRQGNASINVRNKFKAISMVI